MQRNDIQIRDPFVVPVAAEGRYYLYGSTDPDCWATTPGRGFEAYSSLDLEAWDGPFPVFRPAPGFWGSYHFWAPEVHVYRGRYYMFASFKADGRCRGTQILVADGPRGPFVPHSADAVTPHEWECLDGTLFVDDAGNPWLVFCHEWVQVHDGEMCAQRLTDDLTAPLGEPLLLFHASDAPWVARGPAQVDFVTDGPFLYRAGNGDLLMLWSSMGWSGYALGVARSASGRITGPWTQDAEPLFAADGGHGMLFTTFGGQLLVALHQPNNTPNERPQFLPVHEEAGALRLG
ncbi:MAG TPA: glycoside hydrolase family 43 protein [Armatimonadota bacterium]|jgi:beta-xylosidase